MLLPGEEKKNDFDRLMASFFLSEEGDVSALLAPTHPSKFIWSICVVFISPFAVPVVTTVIRGRG